MKHLVTFAFLVAAIVLGIIGSVSGVIIFLVAGVILEVVFWYRVLKKSKASSAPN